MLTPFILTMHQTAILNEFNSIIIALIGFNSSIVMLYLGAATYADAHGTSVTWTEK